MVKRGFKVVRTKPGNKYPGSVMADIRGVRVSYRPGEWATRPDRCGPLAVFTERYEAQRFSFFCILWAEGKTEVWECEYEPNTRAKSLWLSRGDERARLRANEFPPATVLADRVKLIRRVDQ